MLALGAVDIAVIGLNFGFDGASALIGTSTAHCTHSLGSEHERIVCLLPAINILAGSLKLPVIVIQSSGTTSSTESGTLSYRQCDPGFTINNTGGPECLPCINGTYNIQSDAANCAACNAGRYTIAGQSACAACTPGKYSEEGDAVCTDCEAGTYITQSAANECLDCELGTYSGVGQGRNTPHLH